jgi:hypothetical protein
MVGNDPDMTEHPDDILRALADPERLRIAGALAGGGGGGAANPAGIARLQPDRRTYRLDAETLRWAAEQVGPPREAGIALGAANEGEEAVLRAFFRDGRLTEIPTKASKRRIVLERVALAFEPGVRYDEREVNVIVAAFHRDHASLRRYLVDEGFLAREGGVYWRSGGRVDV